MPLLFALIIWELVMALLPMALTAEAGGSPPFSEAWSSPLAAIAVGAGLARLWGAWDSLKGGLLDGISFTLAMGWYLGSLSRYIGSLGELYGSLAGYEPFALSMLTLLVIPGGLLASPMVYIVLSERRRR